MLKTCKYKEKDKCWIYIYVKPAKYINLIYKKVNNEHPTTHLPPSTHNITRPVVVGILYAICITILENM